MRGLSHTDAIGSSFSLKEDRSACKGVPAGSVQPFIEFVARNPNSNFISRVGIPRRAKSIKSTLEFRVSFQIWTFRDPCRHCLELKSFRIISVIRRDQQISSELASEFFRNGNDPLAARDFFPSATCHSLGFVS
jgi:hypothetical protein